VDTRSLAVFKARLDWALSNLVCWEVSLPTAAGLEVGPFQPKPFYDSVNTYIHTEVYERSV